MTNLTEKIRIANEVNTALQLTGMLYLAWRLRDRHADPLMFTCHRQGPALVL